MRPLETPERHYLLGAIGWLELGNLREARAELAQIGQPHWCHPDVLEVRWVISAEEKRWTEALEAAKALVQAAPDRVEGWLHQAYALRRVPEGGLRQAWDALLPVWDKFPTTPLVAYNLACYACQLRQPDVARDWFKKAVDAGGKERMRQMALADEDLQPLWEEIRQL